MKLRTAAVLAFAASAIITPRSAHPADAYRAIMPTPRGDAITLTGHDLTIEQLVAIAHQGQPVEVSPEVRDHQADAHGLLLEAAAEGIVIPGFDTAENNTARAQAAFDNGAAAADAPEVVDEALVRAAMAVRANTLAYQPVTAPVQQMLLDLLNDRITPVVAVPNGSGPGPMANIAAAMVGRGEAYYRGNRMPASQALSLAGLTPIKPADFDDHAFIDTGAFEIARAAFIAAEGGRILEWSDLAYAMNLSGAGAGLAVLTLPAQANRPFEWLNWDSGRVLAILKDSYLLDGKTAIDPEPYPEGFDLSPTRQGAAWQAWGALRNTVLIALNSSDQPVAVRPNLSRREAPELASALMARHYVKGGKLSDGEHGFIVPTANRDPFPLTQTVSTFTAALGDLSVAILARSYGLPKAIPENSTPAEQELGSMERLLAVDLLHAATAMEHLAARMPDLNFGGPVTALLKDFRKAVPADLAPDKAADAAVGFLESQSPAAYFPDGEPPPGYDDGIPLAQGKIHR